MSERDGRSASCQRLFLIVLLCVGGASACRDRSPPISESSLETGSVAFVDVAVLPMTQEDVLLHRTVLVRDGRISDVGSVDEVEIPDGVPRVDGRGKYLLPGLIDSHVHLEHFTDEEQLLLFLVNGVTTVRNMDGRPHVLAWRERQRGGDLLAPRIHTSSPLLDGDPPLWDDSVVVRTTTDADRIVKELSAAGYDQIKVYGFLSSDVYETVVDGAHSLGLKVVGHVPFRVGLIRALEAGQDSIEHLTGYGAMIEPSSSPTYGEWRPHKRFLAVPVDDAQLDRAVDLTVASGAWNCPTLVMHEKSFVAKEDRGAWRSEPGGGHVAWFRRQKWRIIDLVDRETAGRDVIEAARRVRERIVHRLATAGAGILVGTDAGIPFVIPGYSAHEELQYLVQAGLTPYQALRAATVDAARFLGLDKELGTIEPGRTADLILLDANPQASVAATLRLRGVLAGGIWMGPESLAALREKVRW